MTEKELAAVIRGMVPAVREYVSKAVSDSIARISVLEAQAKSTVDLRDRVVAVETKAAQPATPIAPESTIDLSPLLERVAAAEARLSVLGDLRDRVVTVETKAALQVMPEPVTFDAAPLLARLSLLELNLEICQDRLLVAETKAAAPDLGDMPDRLLSVEHRTPTKQLWDALTENITDLRTRVNAMDPITKDVGALRERIAVAEVRALVPGPAGKDGANGADGLNGKDGVDGLGFDDVAVDHDGERNFTFKYARGERVKVAGTFTVPMELYRGVYLDGKSYERGDCVTWGGSEWHANEITTTKPGDGSKAWTLKVKRGRDGKDGRDGHDLVPVVSVGSRG